MLFYLARPGPVVFGQYAAGELGMASPKGLNDQGPVDGVGDRLAYPHVSQDRIAGVEGNVVEDGSPFAARERG